MLSVSETSHFLNRSPYGDPPDESGLIRLCSPFTLRYGTGRMTPPKCVALARQNARSDRVCLDFSLVTFFVAMTKKVTIKLYERVTLRHRSRDLRQ
jgi:hypothetical protein